jgi:hypothetical protein
MKAPQKETTENRAPSCVRRSATDYKVGLTSSCSLALRSHIRERFLGRHHTFGITESRWITLRNSFSFGKANRVNCARPKIPAAPHAGSQREGRKDEISRGGSKQNGRTALC